MSKTNYIPYKVKDIFLAEWGRKSQMVSKTSNLPNGESKTLEFELFTWEKLDYVKKIKEVFNIVKK